MRLLITGGCGFIGSELVNRCYQQLDFNKIIIIDRLDYCSRKTNILEEIWNDNDVHFVKGDLCNYDLLIHLLEIHQIDYVINMAAQTHVDRSFTNSLQFTRDNVLGLHTLIEACRQYGKIKKFVHMSTDEVYGENKNPLAQTEESILDPTNPYAATKSGAEFILRSYGHSYNFPYVIIRGNNVYGHGQYPDKLIPKFILYLHWGIPCTIHGDGSAQRSFVFVSDMADGIIRVLQHGVLREIYNIGSRNEYTVMEITQFLCQKMSKDIQDSIVYVPDRFFNDQRYHINYDKISALGWKEKVSFETGLEQTIEWYLERANEYLEIREKQKNS
jgi:dTDP-glucose 4,6-dehydratase